MSEKQFSIVGKEYISYYCGYAQIISNGTLNFSVWESEEDAQKVCDLLNEQQATISDLKEENEQLRKENFFLGYWKRKAMILLMQVRRLTPRMTDKEVMEFSKELDDE